jgi:hypothetical protein
MTDVKAEIDVVIIMRKQALHHPQVILVTLDIMIWHQKTGIMLHHVTKIQ